MSESHPIDAMIPPLITITMIFWATTVCCKKEHGSIPLQTHSACRKGDDFCPPGPGGVLGFGN